MASATPAIAPTLPSSLSPHVTTVLSPDLVELLTAASLPPLHHILQSYSPLPLVTTRTAAFTPVSHKAFNLRFSDIEYITQACREDEETRSSRFIDWLGTRIARRAPRWVDEITQYQQLNTSHPIPIRTPWWEEIKRCVEGEWVPSRSEGWNHPVAVIYAISTTAPNPLQAVSALYSRPLDLPSWVDPTILRYILIVHPSNSPLNQDECTALYNAIKKQYNLHVHLLNLSLTRAAKPIPIIPLPPQLPPSQTSYGNAAHSTNSHSHSGSVTATGVPDTSELWMSEGDAQATGKFVREFLTQSLLPWMEKCVIEWNDAFINNKRLPSRLFSSTRRLFGSSTTTPTTPTSTPPSGFNPSSPISQPAALAGSVPSQPRRLAEFATFLGDWKLAVTVWESLRKEGKGGPAILPLLLAPSPSFVNYAVQALAPVFGDDPSATALMNAVVCAVRWEAGVHDLLSLGGERWLVWAASTADEASTALLLGHAAHLSRHKGARRRAALWYVLAAHRLEKCGIKALTAYFLGEAYKIYNTDSPKVLSPSYADAEQWPVDIKIPTSNNYPMVLTNIEHSLGRIKYSSGDTEGAVRFFLGLLKYSRMVDGAETDAVVIDDFKQALEHLESTHAGDEIPSDLILPISFCVPNESKIRLGVQNEDVLGGSETVWDTLEARWASSREKGKGKLQQSCAEVGQPFWLDIVLENPIEASVTLKNFTLSFSRSDGQDDATPENPAQCEVIDEIFLLPKERRTISIAITPLEAGKLYISEARYLFISHLPVKESLSIHGKRLNTTAAHLRSVEYSSSRNLSVNVIQGGLAVDIQLLEEDREYEDDVVLMQGEVRRLFLCFRNRSSVDIKELWMIVDETISLSVDDRESAESNHFLSDVDAEALEEVPFTNQMRDHSPIKITLRNGQTLSRGQNLEVPVLLHVSGNTDTRLHLLLTYSHDGPFFFTRLSRDVEVISILTTTASVTPTPTKASLFTLRLEIESSNDEYEVDLEQISAVGTEWTIHPGPRGFSKLNLPPRQMSRTSFQIAHHPNDASERTARMVSERISDFLLGKVQATDDFPSSSLRYSHFGEETISVLPSHLQDLILSSRRRNYIQSLISAFPTISQQMLQRLFPLFSPHTLDIIIFWRIPTLNRHGFITSCDLQIGVGHGLLQGVIERALQSKGKSIYVETKREHELLLHHFRECEWNRETDPVVVAVHPVKPSVEHDFTKGPCLIPVEFTLRNYSSTNPVRYILRLPGNRVTPNLRHSFAAAYSGQLTHHGSLDPSKNNTVKVLLRAKSPGQYSLGGWRMEIEVGRAGIVGSPDQWRILARYLQQSSGTENVVLVRNVSSSG